MNNINTNKTMMQYFHWHYPNDGSLWQKVKKEAADLAKVGITALWLPPAYKEWGVNWGLNYAPYDLYDLGEFFQQNSLRTKYGFKAEYEAAVKSAQELGIDVYADIVFNHKAGGDFIETVEAIRVSHDNRNHEYGENVSIEVATGFDFPGRSGKYSDFKWRWYHFTGVDWAHNFPNDTAIYKFCGKNWNWEVDPEHGNYDYLSNFDIDVSHPEVNAELRNWGKWYFDMIKMDGFRLDGLKHIKFSFFREWVDCMREYAGKDLFVVGEYWSGDIGRLHNYLNKTEEKISLFDVPLHYNFHNASLAGHNYDLRCIFDNTLVKERPKLAVTFVDNHDTQPLQALQSPVLEWFKPLAYALILLREDGYPCVFYADYYGAQYAEEMTITLLSHKKILDCLLAARRDFAYGIQYSYFDHPNFVGWTRLGDTKHPKSIAVLLNNMPYVQGEKWMNVERPNAVFYDCTGNRTDKVYTNEDGWGEFKANPTSVSVWIQE